MQKIKKYLLMALIMVVFGPQMQLFSQNVIWIESAFASPRLVKTAADGNEMLSKSLPAGSLPQGIGQYERGKSFVWTGLSFDGAQVNKASADFSLSAVLVDSQSVLRGIAVDPYNKKMYWASTNLISGPKIWMAGLGGENASVLIDFGPASDNVPRSIGLDIKAGKIYWTNFSAGKIQRANLLDGTVPEDILTGLNGPSGLALDADSAKIFWTEMNGHEIKSADLGGTNVTLLVDSVSFPNYISVDRKLNRMAWTELGSGKVKSATLTGSDVFDYNVNAIAPAGILIESHVDTNIVINGDLLIVPKDTTIQVQNFVQFAAHLVDSQKVHTETSAAWDIIRRNVGPIDQDGLLFAYFPGKAFVKAQVDSMTAKAILAVIDTTVDSTGTNEVTFVRIFPNGKEKNPKKIEEGKIFKLTGLPNPYNIINGTTVFFPKGSLREDITIEVKLPKFAKFIGDSIEFANKIVNAIQFDVFVKDTLVEPYFFDKPVSIAMPFKRGILKKYGISIQELGMFFARDSVSLDTLGISHVMVDSADSRIYGLVEHFSTLALHENKIVSSVDLDKTENNSPEIFQLSQNYPNPFNPTTLITYQIPKDSEVKLSIFNALGQRVATLVSERKIAGTYNVQWQAAGFASGIYLYRLETDQGFTQTKKLILLK